MAKTDFKSVDDYLALQPEATRAVLERVRQAIRKALPEAVERISYQIPAFKLHGSPVIYFAGWKEHYSLYPASGRLVAKFRKELSPYVVSKGTIRLPLSRRVPTRLITAVARFRATEADERRAARSSKGQGRGTKRSDSVRRQLTGADFRRLALSLDGVEEGSHMGAVDFRVGGHIFATLASVKDGFGNLMLTPEIQAEFVAERPDVFIPIAGGWGRMGSTHIRLAKANPDMLASALRVAWQVRVDKNSHRTRRSGRKPSQSSAPRR